MPVSRRLYECMLCLFGLGAINGAFAQQKLTINTDFVENTLQGYLWHFPDATHQFDVDQILEIRRKGGGEVLNRQVSNLGDGNESHWLVFNVQNQTVKSQQLVLEVHLMLDEIEFFAFDGPKLIRHVPTYSWHVPTIDRDLPHTAFTYWLELPTRHIQTIAFRLVRKNGVLSLPIKLHQQRKFTLNTEHNHLMHGLAAGVLLLAFILGIALFMLSRKWLYFFYAGYILGISIFILAEQDYLNQYLLPYSNTLAGPGAWAIGLMISTFNHNFFSLLFLRIGLRKRNYLVYLCWGVNGIAAGIFGWLIIGFPLSDILYQVVLFLCAAYILLAFAILIYGIFKRTLEAYLYTLAVGPFFFLSILTVFSMLDILPRLWLVIELIDYAPIAEIVVLCVGLAYTFQRSQLEKVKALLVISNLREKVVTVRADAQGAERKRIAADLHDNLGGMMSAIRLSIEAMDTSALSPKEKAVYENVLNMTRQAYNDVRLLAHNLQPEELEKFGLSEALQRLVHKLNDSQLIHFSLITNSLARLSKELEFNLYSICLELANNIVKHSQASEATFEFVTKNEQLQLFVTDNGQGFMANNTSDGMGMRTVQERTGQMGGTLKIHSQPGEGTMFLFSIPLTLPTHAL